MNKSLTNLLDEIDIIIKRKFIVKEPPKQTVQIPEWKPVFDMLEDGKAVKLTTDEIIKLQLITEVLLKYEPGQIIILSFTHEGLQIPFGQEFHFVEEVRKGIRPAGYQMQAKTPGRFIPIEDRLHKSRIPDLKCWRFAVFNAGYDSWYVTKIPFCDKADHKTRDYDNNLELNDSFIEKKMEEAQMKAFRSIPHRDPFADWQLDVMKELAKNATSAFKENYMTPEEAKIKMQEIIEIHKPKQHVSRQDPVIQEIFKQQKQASPQKLTEEPVVKQSASPQMSSLAQKLGLSMRK